MKFKKNFYLYLHFLDVFSWIRIFRIGSGLRNPSPIRIGGKTRIRNTAFNPHYSTLTIYPSPFIPHHSSLTIRTSPFVLHHSPLFPIAPKKYHSFLSIRSLWYRTGKISLFTKYPRTLTIPPLLVYSSLTVHHHYHSSLILPKSYFFQLPVCNRYW